MACTTGDGEVNSINIHQVFNCSILNGEAFLVTFLSHLFREINIGVFIFFYELSLNFKLFFKGFYGFIIRPFTGMNKKNVFQSKQYLSILSFLLHLVHQ